MHENITFPRDDRRFKEKLGSNALNGSGLAARPDTRIIHTPDGRQLTAQVSGQQGGKVAFLFHGMPGSRLDPSLENSRLRGMNVQFVSFDRPGYGGSTPHPGRRPTDVVADVERLANGLGMYPDYVIGKSGGCPYALACAARLCVEKAAILVPSGSRTLMGSRLWYKGMAASNVEGYQAAESDPAKLDDLLTEQRAKILGPKADDGAFDPGYTSGDREVMRRSGLRAGIDCSHQEGLRDGIGGWRDDVLAAVADWGFDLKGIDVPTFIWAAADDVFAPSQHAEWLADRIPRAELTIEAGASHSLATERLPEVIGWCLTGEYSNILD